VAVRRLVVVAAGVAVALAVGLWLGLWRQHTAQYPTEPLAARATLAPRTFDFADPLTARFDVLVDPRAVDPASVRVQQRFGLFHLLGAQLRVRKTGGVLLSYRYTLECVVSGCLPGRTLAERRFLPALVSYRTVTGRKRRAVVAWPTYIVATHLSTSDTGDPTLHLRADAPLPPVSYRISPRTLQALLAALAAVLVLGAAGLVAVALPRRRGAAGPKLPPLDEALALVRASTLNGHNGERRRALGRLARVLRVEGQGELAGAAVRLAWSSDPPSAEATSELADEVEASL
jgi:hypothetical protein